MIIKEALNDAIKRLKENNIEDATIKARELLAYVLKKEKQYLVINNDKTIEKRAYMLYNNIITKLILGIPLQYITNKQEFMGLSFYVDNNVLIPQPDTEILVEEVIKIAKDNYENNKELQILDLCTGSGAIAISLAKYINFKKEIYASDISNKALEIANKNAINNNVKVKFIQSDVFEKINNKFDIIVSNPPYIETKTIKTLSKEVQNEPVIALDGGTDGLDFYKKIALEGYRYLKDKGFLCLEIGYNQKDVVIEILNNIGKYSNINVLKDLSGNNRCIIANKRG